jgi:hypothetical protein
MSNNEQKRAASKAAVVLTQTLAELPLTAIEALAAAEICFRLGVHATTKRSPDAVHQAHELAEKIITTTIGASS